MLWNPWCPLSFKLLAECFQDLGLMRFARQSMRHALSQEKRTSGLISPTFCHGEAGVVTSAIAILGRNTNGLDASLIESHVSTLLNFLILNYRSVFRITRLLRVGKTKLVFYLEAQE